MTDQRPLSKRLEKQGSHKLYGFGDIAYYTLTDEDLDEIRALEQSVISLTGIARNWQKASNNWQLRAIAAEQRLTELPTHLYPPENTEEV